MKPLRNEKIVYFHPSAEMYGADRMALESALALNENYTVTVVLPSHGPLAEELVAHGLTVRILNIFVLRKSLLSARGILNLIAKTPNNIKQIRDLIKKESANAVYANTIIQPWVLAASAVSKIPSAVHVREAENSLPKIIQIILNLPLVFANQVICNSATTKIHVENNNPAVRNKISVIYNGKDWSKYYRSACRVRVDHDTFAMVLVGRLSPRKGTDIAIEALIRLRQQGIDATLDLVGSVFDGYEWYEEQLREQANSAGVGEFCRFLGFQTDTAIHMEAADVVLVPSREEPFGSVAAEAQAAKRPVIVAAEGGLPEIVTHERTGLIFESGNIEDLVHQCKRLADEPGFAAELSENGFESVNNKFALELYRNRVIQVVENLVSLKA